MVALDKSLRHSSSLVSSLIIINKGSWKTKWFLILSLSICMFYLNTFKCENLISHQVLVFNLELVLDFAIPTSAKLHVYFNVDWAISHCNQITYIHVGCSLMSATVMNTNNSVFIIYAVPTYQLSLFSFITPNIHISPT